MTVYIKYAKVQEGDETSKEQAQSITRPDIDDENRRCTERSKLGINVCSLGKLAPVNILKQPEEFPFYEIKHRLNKGQMCSYLPCPFPEGNDIYFI